MVIMAQTGNSSVLIQLPKHCSFFLMLCVCPNFCCSFQSCSYSSLSFLKCRPCRLYAMLRWSMSIAFCTPLLLHLLLVQIANDFAAAKRQSPIDNEWVMPSNNGTFGLVHCNTPFSFAYTHSYINARCKRMHFTHNIFALCSRFTIK